MNAAVPSEFVEFVKQIGIRAFERLALRSSELDPPLRALLKNWSRFSESEKNEFFDELIAAARMADAPPAPPREVRQRKPVKRYDPEEVAATLPKKPPNKKAAKKPTTAKKK